MQLNMLELGGQTVAEVLSEEVVINDTRDALDLMATAQYQGATGIVLYEKNLKPEFFDLKTGMAGEILQKYTNYRMRIAIVGDFEKFESKSLKAFIVESNRGKMVAFVSDRETALAKISS
ncbi:DUF4180 domain-containing protein [soil metagenome]